MGSCCENTGVVAIPSSSGPRFVRTLHYDPSVLLKILQASLQQYVNQELPDVQAGFRKGRGTRDQIANIHWITEKEREFKENLYFCFIDYTKAFDWPVADSFDVWQNQYNIVK